jgi:ABC-type uncharacterized transport system substrate-binding protein
METFLIPVLAYLIGEIVVRTALGKTRDAPTKFELIINLKAAKQIGLTIPQSILFQTDKLIK